MRGSVVRDVAGEPLGAPDQRLLLAQLDPDGRAFHAGELAEQVVEAAVLEHHVHDALDRRRGVDLGRGVAELRDHLAARAREEHAAGERHRRAVQEPPAGEVRDRVASARVLRHGDACVRACFLCIKRSAHRYPGRTVHTGSSHRAPILSAVQEQAERPTDRRPPMRRFVVVLALLATVAAACDDGGGEGQPTVPSRRRRLRARRRRASRSCRRPASRPRRPSPRFPSPPRRPEGRLRRRASRAGGRPPRDTPQFTDPLGIVRRTAPVDGDFVVVDMRYFTGPESPPSDKGYILEIDRWYIKLYVESDWSYQGRFIVEQRTFGRGAGRGRSVRHEGVPLAGLDRVPVGLGRHHRARVSGPAGAVAGHALRLREGRRRPRDRGPPRRGARVPPGNVRRRPEGFRPWRHPPPDGSMSP